MPEEDVGMVSNPVPNREEYSRVRFGDKSHRQGKNTAELTEEDGSLTLATKPKLSFPDDNTKAISTKEGVLVVNVHQAPEPSNEQQHRGPSSVKSHDEAFAHALQNTNSMPLVLKEPVVVVSSGPVVSGAVAPANPKASGFRRPLEMINDDDDPANGDIVTQLQQQFSVKNLRHPGACVERMIKAQTQKLEQILATLGESKDSRDMHEIKALIDEWHNRFRDKVISAKEKTSKLEISKALENLIKLFDRVNLDLIKSQVNA
ncbi:hypothetical protein OSTOST_16129, partial [Ostertagia ostertagi]